MNCKWIERIVATGLCAIFMLVITACSIADVNSHTDAESNIMGNSVNGGLAVSDGEWIYSVCVDNVYWKWYYIGASSGDTSDNQKILERIAVPAELTNSYRIYRQRLDGSERQIFDAWGEGLCIMDGRLYFYNSSDYSGEYKHRICSISTDGTGLLEHYITYSSISGLCCDENSLYFIEDGCKIMRMDIPSKQITQIVDGTTGISNLNASGEFVYFISSDGQNSKLYQCSILSGEYRCIVDKYVCRTILDGDVLYYLEFECNPEADESFMGWVHLYSYSPEEGSKLLYHRLSSSGDFNNFNIVDGVAYYDSYRENGNSNDELSGPWGTVLVCHKLKTNEISYCAIETHQDYNENKAYRNYLCVVGDHIIYPLDNVRDNLCREEVVRWSTTDGRYTPEFELTINEGLALWEQTRFIDRSDITSIDSRYYLLQSQNGNEGYYLCNRHDDIDMIFPTQIDGLTITTAGVYNEEPQKACLLESIIIPDSINNLSDGAFAGCTKLKSCTLSAELKKIPRYAFIGCTAIEEIILPDGINYIGERAFYNCVSLTTVYIPDSVKNIAPDAFEGCSDNLIITGIEGSYAQQFANSQGITFNS